MANDAADGSVSSGRADPVDDADNTQMAQQNILRVQIREGLSELNRSTAGLFLSALSAGLDIGFGPFFMAITLTVADFSFASVLTRELLIANAYAIGFLFVILGRSELFTEHTTLAVLPVLDGQASLRQLGRLWAIVYAGNLVGATIFAGIIVAVAPTLGVVEPKAFVEIARTLTDHGWAVLLGAGILAGWLMGLLSWLVAAAQESVSRLLFVWIVAASIGFAHLPHSIAGTVEVLVGVFGSQQVTVLDFLRFLVPATVGNAIGGSVFVSLLKYGHVVESGPVPDD